MLDTLEPSGYVDRVTDAAVAAALEAMPTVVIEGPKGCGKTWTGRRFARSEVLFDRDLNARRSVSVAPGLALEGPEPRLLDEWQLAPEVSKTFRLGDPIFVREPSCGLRPSAISSIRRLQPPPSVVVRRGSCQTSKRSDSCSSRWQYGICASTASSTALSSPAIAIAISRDSDQLEADVVIEARDGRWIAAEVKLGGERDIEQAARSLLRLRAKVDTSRVGEPSKLLIITSAGYGYDRPDGTTVVPITALGP